ncbi:MAG: response regulator [Planctomycetaceae bacterium]|jgi:putative two-component system response regulator|nr:response regulator [Planctomycetaceae bacterium]
MQVLIVDDSKLALIALKGLLVKNGYEVFTASNGKEGLEILGKQEQCRAVISDWEMPEMNGIEFCRAVRAQDRSGYIYFLLLTSHGQVAEMVQGLSAGADDFIAKPYNPSEVLARLRAGERILSLETRDVAIFALAKLAESRDNDTGSHLERVQYYCRALSQYLADHDRFKAQIDPEYIRLIFQTSPLHDIGKVGIPDAILLKPGRLDPAEFEIMKTHTTIAAHTMEAALEKFPGVAFLKMAKEIAESHHEKYDGTGYPHGLKGDAIPLCGRIMAVGDVYDALISKRVYKDAFTHDSARAVIEEGKGRHFDPDVVAAFLAVEDQFLDIHHRFAEE